MSNPLRRRRSDIRKEGPLSRLRMLLGFFLILVFVGPMTLIIAAYLLLASNLEGLGHEIEVIRARTEETLVNSVDRLQLTFEKADSAITSTIRRHFRERFVDLAYRTEQAVSRLPENQRHNPAALASLPEIQHILQSALPANNVVTIVDLASTEILAHKTHPSGSLLSEKIPFLHEVLIKDKERLSIGPRRSTSDLDTSSTHGDYHGRITHSGRRIEPNEMPSHLMPTQDELAFGQASERRNILVRAHKVNPEGNEIWLWLITPLEGSSLALAMGSYLPSPDKEQLTKIPGIIARNQTEVEERTAQINEMVLGFQTKRENLVALVKNYILYGGALAIGIVIIALITVHRRVVTPMHRMTAVTEQVREGDYASRIAISATGEIGALATAIDDMLDRLVSLIHSDEDRRRMQQSIVDLLEQVSRASRGDLTVRGPVSDDVLGSVVDALNHMLESIGRLIVQVRTAGERVTNAADSILGAQNRVDEGAARQSDRLDSAVSQIEAVASAMREIAGAAGAASKAAKKADDTAIIGRTAVDDTIGAMYAIHRDVATAARKIKGLGERSLEIDTIVDLIDDIAAQTNVLALNASIEASRAGGEKGKGFDVVAEEVQRLAERSSTATREISTLVQGIQEGAGQAVSAMEAVQRQVEEGVRTADDAGHALSDIGIVVHTASELIESIHASANMEADGASHMTETLDELHKLASETAEQVRLTTRSVGELLDLSRALDEAMRRFRVEKNLPQPLIESIAEQRRAFEDSMLEFQDALASGNTSQEQMQRLGKVANSARERLAHLLEDAFGDSPNTPPILIARSEDNSTKDEADLPSKEEEEEER